MAACHQLEMPRRGRKHLFGGNHPQNPEPTGKGQKHSQDLDWKAGIRHTSRQGHDSLRHGDLFIPWVKSRGQTLLDQ